MGPMTKVEEARKIVEAMGEALRAAKEAYAAAEDILFRSEKQERAENFKPNATMRRDIIPYIAMNDERAHIPCDLSVGERVQVGKADHPWESVDVVRADGRLFRLEQDAFARDAEPEAAPRPELAGPTHLLVYPLVYLGGKTECGLELEGRRVAVSLAAFRKTSERCPGCAAR